MLEIVFALGIPLRLDRAPRWIPERSATLFRKADLNVLSKLGHQGL
jgi:hypothetical protein